MNSDPWGKSKGGSRGGPPFEAPSRSPTYSLHFDRG